MPVSTFFHRGYKHTSLCHSSHVVQLLMGCCVPEPGHGDGEAPACCQNLSLPSHSSMPLPEQALHPAMLRSSPIPGCLHISPLFSSTCLPPPSPCSCLQCSWLQPQGWVSSRNCQKVQQGVLERARDGGAVSKGNTAGAQTTGFILSFSTCSPALSWHTGTQHPESQKHRTFPAQSDLPIIREITTLEQRGWGYPWGYPWE